MTLAIIIFPLLLGSSPPFINVFDSVNNRSSLFNVQKPSSEIPGIYSSLLNRFGTDLGSIILVSSSQEMEDKWEAGAINIGLLSTFHPVSKSKVREISYLSKFTNPKPGDVGSFIELSNDGKSAKYKAVGEVLKVEGNDVIKTVFKISKEIEPTVDEIASIFSGIHSLKWKVVGIPSTMSIDDSNEFVTVPISTRMEVEGAEILARYLTGSKSPYFNKINPQ